MRGLLPSFATQNPPPSRREANGTARFNNRYQAIYKISLFTPHPLRLRSAPSPTGEGKGDANMCLHNIIRCRINVHPKRVAEDVAPYGLVRHFTHKPSLPQRGKAKSEPQNVMRRVESLTVCAVIIFFPRGNSIPACQSFWNPKPFFKKVLVAEGNAS